MYEIVIEYTTGNSFGSYEDEDTVGWSFETRDEARVVLGYIKEHYEMCRGLQGYNLNGTRKSILELYSKNSWFDKQYPEGGLLYKGRRISCFWTGYFETLRKAHITCKDDDKDYIKF